MYDTTIFIQTVSTSIYLTTHHDNKTTNKNGNWIREISSIDTRTDYKIRSRQHTKHRDVVNMTTRFHLETTCRYA